MNNWHDGVDIGQRDLNIIHGDHLGFLGHRLLLLLLDVLDTRKLLYRVAPFRVSGGGLRRRRLRGGGLGDAGYFGPLGGEESAAERGLVDERAFAAVGVLEGDEREKTEANECCEEPERSTPAETLRQGTAYDGPERGSKEGCAVVDSHHGTALSGLVDIDEG